MRQLNRHYIRMDISFMEPMVPAEAVRDLEEPLYDLVAVASHLGGRVYYPILRESIGDLVRSMNCYFSNLIEGHDTHPRDIDRALASDFSNEPKRRELQLEAVAHIHVQKVIDTGNDPDVWPASNAYATWLHREFCRRLPPEMLWVTNKDTGKRVALIPGEWRKGYVQVGRHKPGPDDLARFMNRFGEAYKSPPLNRPRQIQTVGAAHHRFLWIHPFLDGNGRVARRMSHALLRRLDIGTSLWPVARGLARDEKRYNDRLGQADNPRQGDRDGRGNLTQSGLVEFCEFFLNTCTDQVKFMTTLLEPDKLMTRIEIHIEEEMRAKRLPKGSFEVLREAVHTGEVERSKVPSLTGYKERNARNVTAALVDRGMLTSTSHRAPLRLAFPSDAVERWLPNLYPANAGSRP